MYSGLYIPDMFNAYAFHQRTELTVTSSYQQRRVWLVGIAPIFSEALSSLEELPISPKTDLDNYVGLIRWKISRPTAVGAKRIILQHKWDAGYSYGAEKLRNNQKFISGRKELSLVEARVQREFLSRELPHLLYLLQYQQDSPSEPPPITSPTPTPPPPPPPDRYSAPPQS